MNRAASRIACPSKEESEWTIQNHKLLRFPKLSLAYLVEENVLGFNVSVDDIAVVHEFHGVADLPSNFPHFLLPETALVP